MTIILRFSLVYLLHYYESFMAEKYFSRGKSYCLSQSFTVIIRTTFLIARFRDGEKSEKKRYC